MSSEVPPVDREPSNGSDPSGRLADLEIRLLDAGAKAKENLNREADQRYYLRWLAVLVGLVIIALMGGMLWHMTHQIFFGPFLAVSSSYAMTLVIAPIVSMTTITITLFVAAFRGFKKDDEESAASAMTDSAKAVTGLN